MRIVSLCPSTTETLVELGLAESLVGVTRFCIHPADVVARLVKVGGTKDPNLARIRALRPDLVLMNAEENRQPDHEALAADLRVDVTHPRTVKEVPALLRHFGTLTETAERAEVHAVALEQALAALRPARQPWSYLYLIWRDPWMAAGPGTYIDDLLGLAGGVNVVTAPDYPAVDVGALRPAVVLLPDEPFPFTDKHVPELRALQPTARIERISGDDACWHGVRSIRGVALVQRLADLVDHLAAKPSAPTES